MLPGITVSGVRSETVTSAPSARAPRTSPERFPRPAAGPPVAGRGAKYAPRRSPENAPETATETRRNPPTPSLAGTRVLTARLCGRVGPSGDCQSEVVTCRKPKRHFWRDHGKNPESGTRLATTTRAHLAGKWRARRDLGPRPLAVNATRPSAGPAVGTFYTFRHLTQSTDGRRGCLGIVSPRLRRGLRVGAAGAATPVIWRVVLHGRSHRSAEEGNP